MRFRDKFLDPRQSSVVSDCRNADAQRVIGGDGSGDDMGAGPPADSTGLSGNHRLVDVGGALRDLPIGWHPASRSDDDAISDGKIGGRHHLNAVTDDPLRFVRKQRCQRFQSGRGLSEGTHFDPMPEQHDDNQQREFPPEIELLIKQAQSGPK